MSGLKGKIEIRAKMETGLAILAAALSVLTLISREWIEFLTGWDPDHGNGSFEWLIVVVLAMMAIGLGLRARSDWRKVQALPA
jgi:hypothetical protein